MDLTFTVTETTPGFLSGSQTWLTCAVGEQPVAWLHRRKPARADACEPWRVRFVEDPYPTAAFYPRAYAEVIGLNARLGSCQVHAGGRNEAVAFVRNRVQPTLP
jgi:hypothetical protein